MAINLGNDGDDDKIMADINVTPLIDIMLVLLIVFMVTSSVSLESGLDIDLPQVKSKTEGKSKSAVIVTLSTTGKIYVQGELVSSETFSESISKALESEETKLVILEGDKKARLGMAVEIMDLARAAGAERFAIAAESD
jgi:biopolymer transport protein ExbD